MGKHSSHRLLTAPIGARFWLQAPASLRQLLAPWWQRMQSATTLRLPRPFVLRTLLSCQPVPRNPVTRSPATRPLPARTGMARHVPHSVPPLTQSAARRTTRLSAAPQRPLPVAHSVVRPAPRFALRVRPASLHAQRLAVRASLRLALGKIYVRQAWGEARQWLRQHPHAAGSTMVGALTLGAGAAFAVVIPAADASIAKRKVVEVVQPPASYAQQSAQLQAQPLTLYRSTETRDTDTASSLLARLGVRDAAAAAYIRQTDVVRAEVLGLKRRFVMAEAGADRRLQRLRLIWQNPEQPRQYKQLDIFRDGADAALRHVFDTGVADVTPAFGRADIRGAYYRSAAAADIPTAVADQVVDIFQSVADIPRQTRRGDHLTVVYERMSYQGIDLGTGRVLSASITVDGQPHRAVWFGGAGKSREGDAGRYYQPSGEGLGLAYLPTPIPGARITSGFEPYRVHPIFGDVRSHTGVDYAAPAGTPIQVVADGTVSFAGQQTGYGNVVIVQHGGQASTLYAHMSHMAVRSGDKVRQGQVLGQVGTSGWSTGAHLHFETRDNGVPENPESVLAQRRSQSIASNQRTAFINAVVQAEQLWAQVQDIRTASAE